MKTIIALILSIMTVSAFAASVSETISRIEADKNVRCELASTGFELCYSLFGVKKENAVCKYTQTFACEGADEFLTVLKVKEFPNRQSGKRETEVLKLQYRSL